ncbi:hypothetical protein HN018_20850 [Lichenicola cladoniae]|uniref:DUF2384 domain-containing protein n=1 Tax=Lichenicola cladoniae TaxID=1484109 RepID=A0A6M8HV91_9PROT|nr:hypothetical protein [Lichenicola cladoniae]NPD69473.1 hypothetical protein [Acetobacteraceae bacterium]QKE92156.1 hypothetical protein HN018_20850 [Lichenicola cladoniae]
MSPGPTSKELLKQAKQSLDDARLLAEHRRRNEGVLTRLALHQALQAISISEGLDANDDLRLDTLLKRVPEDHPQAALLATLRSEDAQTIAAVAGLVEALDRPKAKPTATPKPAPAPVTEPGEDDTNDAPETDETRFDDLDPSALTALGTSPQGHGRADPASSFPSAAFWSLMDRWGIEDLDALALVGHAGGLTKKGTRPRFRLQGAEAHRYAALRALDTALSTLGQEPADFLRAKQTRAPFDGDTPLAVLHRDGADGARSLIRDLTRQGFQAGLKRALEQN